MLLNYNIYSNCVDLIFSNGNTYRVYFNNRTGLVIKRPKKHPIGKYFIDHKGIVLGNLSDGTEIVLHNHIDYKKAVVDTLTGFENGIKSQIDYKTCTNDTYTQLEIALNDIIIGKPYKRIDNNCQVYVNKACSNKSKSDDTLRVLAGVGMFSLLAFGLIASLSSEPSRK